MVTLLQIFIIQIVVRAGRSCRNKAVNSVRTKIWVEIKTSGCSERNVGLQVSVMDIGNLAVNRE